MAKRLKTAEQLAREYDCGTEKNTLCANYYEVLEYTWTCGHRNQFREQFMRMCLRDRKEYQRYLIERIMTDEVGNLGDIKEMLLKTL